MKQYVYQFKKGCAEGSATMSDKLGGKGANLAEMSNLNIPVPPGFTISTDVCVYYMKHNKYPPGLKREVRRALSVLEKQMGQSFGSTTNPLLVSVRSGAKISMPGMMETVLNVGLNNQSVLALARASNNKAFAYDSYRRLLMMYADVVMERSNNLDFNIRLQLEKMIYQLKKKREIKNDSQISGEDHEQLSKQFIKTINKTLGFSFPQDPLDQLWGAIDAVFKSWNGERARSYRTIEKISHSLGTAVNVQVMVFGNWGNSSGTGVAFTRDPSTGTNCFFGEWLPNAQGEDVVAGIRTPLPINDIKNKKSLRQCMPKIYNSLYSIQKKLEKHYKDMQDLEFTIQNNRLWILQTRKGKRNGPAAIKIALDLMGEKTISKQTALGRIGSHHINELLHPTLTNNDKVNKKPISEGLPAGPGSAYGQVVFNPDKAKELNDRGHAVILVREETSPEDVHGMYASNAILTARGGMTSHAALVARGWGKCCIVGCNDVSINYDKNFCFIGTKKINELDWLTLNGSEGKIYAEKLTLEKPNIKKNKSFINMLKVCKQAKALEVRANADSEQDAKQALSLGAQGIGLCRTEHMFFNPKRIHQVRKMILSTDEKKKKQALKNLLSYQKKDFYNILKTMSPHPVTIRLLDPPLHEFLPEKKSAITKIAKELSLKTYELEKQIDSMKEINPMLGHRGCRLGITSPEITQMQVSAILHSAYLLHLENIRCVPEIMVPLVGSIQEFIDQKNIIQNVANDIDKKYKTKLNFLIGTMIELPRACIIADEIAKHADFISFGTNDLTQTTYGFSRDDINSFLPNYINNSIIKTDPFQSLDTEGVGYLIKLAIQDGRCSNPKLKIGICGEHGGDPNSILFFNNNNLNYVSCSPYRVPIARLYAAKGELKNV